MLEKLEIKGTRDTPEVIFDAKKEIFIIKGNSLPEDPAKFFTPVLEWIAEYIKTPNKTTHLICHFEYFNSSSAKMIYELFILLERINNTNNNIKISWYYEPGDKLIEEKGIEYQSILNIPMDVIEEN